MPYYTPEQRCRGLATRRRNARYRREEARKNKAEIEAKRGFKTGNPTINFGKNVVVTKRVASRLIKKSESDIPSPTISSTLAAGEKASIIIPLLASIIGIIVMVRFGAELGWFNIIIFFLTIIAPWIVVDLLLEPRNRRLWKVYNEQLDERQAEVGSRVRELAEERARRLEEMKQFYSSPEWQLIRKQVILKQGEVCSECLKPIFKKIDVTVDHIRPRSKYPHLALKKRNLRVLCRSCNSRKGDSDSELFIQQT